MSVFRPKPKQDKSVEKKTTSGAFRTFLAAGIASAAILGTALFTSCSEKNNPVGYYGTDTTRVVHDTITIPNDSIPNQAERQSPYRGQILYSYNGQEKIANEGVSTTLPNGFKVKFDYVNKSPSDTTKAEADAKVYNQNDSLVASVRSIMKGQIFQIPGTTSTIGLVGVEFEFAYNTDAALLRSPLYSATGESFLQRYLILHEGANNFKTTTPNGQIINQSVNAVIFIGYEGERRLAVGNSVYHINSNRVPITTSVSAQVFGIDFMQPSKRITYTLLAKDSKTGEQFRRSFEAGQSGSTAIPAFSMPASSKDTTAYRIEFSNIFMVGGPFETGTYGPNNTYEPGSWDTYIIGANIKQVVAGSTKVEVSYTYLRITYNPIQTRWESLYLPDLNTVLSIESASSR
ncbi:MAG: hypothetical protein V1822_03225 [Candidatus Micrarchaeota archaeon]